MFLSFPLYPEVQEYCGVDLNPYLSNLEEPAKPPWEGWTRCVMGLKPSPYWCIKFLLLALETIWGDSTNPSNPFHWSETRLNLPGQIDYDPSKPKLQRVQGNSAELAAFILSYVDDMRVGSPEAGLCWEVLHLVSSMAAYLGIQVASRKTRPPSPHPGPWAG